jgi:elongation factor Ts
MQISAAMVKELRERTGAGMMDCKKALQEADGDIEAAIENMRKSGIAKAAKKAGRIASEGVILIKVSDDGTRAVLLEVNCETDFVAKDASFLDFSNNVIAVALNQWQADLEAVKGSPIDNGAATVEESRLELVTKIGENIDIRRLERVQRRGDILGSYAHGSRIGVVVDVSGGDDALAKDLAMHIAASRPVCVNADQVPAELLAKEKEIYTAQALESGKPEAIVEKMVSGRINKFLQEITLLGQPFVKDPDQSVAKLLQAHQASVNGFVRFEAGEGIEKKQEDFAAEVMAQAGMKK